MRTTAADMAAGGDEDRRAPQDGKTARGFHIVSFRDRNFEQCSLQKSSIATEDCVWFGCDELNLQLFEAGRGWRRVELPNVHPAGPYYVANTRMHLTRAQVGQLLPYLQRFFDTGELMEEDSA